MVLLTNPAWPCTPPPNSDGKDDAIAMVENILTGNDYNLQILYDRINMIPKVILVKFDSRIHAEAFARRHAGNQFIFLDNYDNFWCNKRQSFGSA